MAKPEREHPRYAHEAAVTLHARGAAHRGRTSNVSRGGLCADLGVALPIGTDVEIDMQLVFDGGLHSDALRVSARVVWCTTVDDGHQVGLAFKPLDADRAKLIALFLRYLDDDVPRPKAPRASDRAVDDRFG